MNNPSLTEEVKNLTKIYPIISEQMSLKRLQIILKELATLIFINNQPGDIVEFGCYSGTTSLFIRRLLNLAEKNNNQRTFHVYDSFEGLPAKTIEDASVVGSNFKAGELKSSKRELIRNFKKAGLKTPTIHKSWFSNLKSKDMPD